MSDQPPKKAGVLLIHGIGDIHGGAVAAATVEGLAARTDAGLSFPDVAEMRRLKEPQPKGVNREPVDYPYHLRRAVATDGGGEAVFAELYWSDVKSIDARKAQPLLLFLGSLLQAHRVIGALLAGRADPIAAALRPLLLFGAFLLRGPIVGLNIVLLITLLALKYCAIAQQTLGFQMQGFYFVLGGLGFSALGALLLISKRLFRHPLFVEIGWSVLALSLLGGAFAGAWLAQTGFSGFNEFAFFAQSWLFLVALWLAFASVLVLATLLLLLDLLSFFRAGARRTRRSALLAAAILLFQALLWSTGMRIFWLTLNEDLVSSIDRGLIPMLSGAEVLKTLQFTVLLNIVALAAVYLVVIFVGLARMLIARSFSPERLASGWLAPRLIFSPPALAVTLALGLLSVVSSIAVVLGQGPVAAAVQGAAPDMAAPLYAVLYGDVLPWLDQRALEFAASSLVIGAPVAVVAFRGLLAQGSFLLQDIIDYQPDGPAARRRRGMELSDEHGEGDPGMVSAARGRINLRLEQATADLIEREKIDRLVVAAHSQGSVVLYDLLPDVLTQCRAAGISVRIITMGSPLAHIYSHYFEEYVDLGAGLNRFRGAVEDWKNFYRVDDAIGARLSGQNTCFVQELALPKGGHANYWRERAVGDAILEAIHHPSPFKPPSKTPSKTLA